MFKSGSEFNCVNPANKKQLDIKKAVIPFFFKREKSSQQFFCTRLLVNI